MTTRAKALLGWMLGAIAFRLITACSTDVSGAGKGPAMIAESLCTPYGYTCGKVYQFDDQPRDNELGLLEMCVRKSDLPTAIAWYGPARPSTHPRFDDANICLWCCSTPDKTCPPKGANAYDGPFCLGVGP